MFEKFLSRLFEPEPDPLDDGDARLALTALLVRVARSDDDYAQTEAEHITRIITTRYDLTGPEAEALRADAEVLESEAPDTVRFTRAIKQAVPYDDRLAVIDALWQVALVDGGRDAGEDALLRLVSKFLGISDRDSALVRQRITGA